VGIKRDTTMCLPMSNGAPPQPDEPCLMADAWLIGLRPATDGDTLCPVMDRLWR